MLGWLIVLLLSVAAGVAYNYYSWLPKKNFKGKVVLVTGGGSGLGKLLSGKFALDGAKLVLWDIREDLLQKAEQELKAQNKDLFVKSYVVDLSNREMIYQRAEEVKKEVGQVQVLVNNAGIVSGAKFLECTDKQIEMTMKVNVMAHMWTLKSFLPAMISSNDGHIINIASAAGLCGVTGLADYCASKFAAVGFDESIRLELKKIKATGVHTTVVCPFYINTGMFEGVTTLKAITPILDQHWVVNKIIQAAKAEREVLFLPGIVGLAPIFRSILPTGLYDRIGHLMGLSRAMDEFKGRGKDWALKELTKKDS